MVARLWQARRRAPRVLPRPEAVTDTSVTVLVPTLDEGAHIAACLQGLARQGPPVAQVVVIDSGSTDDTATIVRSFATRDSRIGFELDPPLPPGWIGKVWALQHGLASARGTWVLGVDADTIAEPGMAAGVVAAAREHHLDAVSFSPRFIGQSRGERWLQPSMVVTLVYRLGAPGRRVSPDRVMANGQCFLVRREVLVRHGGYAPARRSFADDVALARHLARAGARVAFLDGSRLYAVRGYGSIRTLWREWGRSFDLADVTPAWRQVIDVVTIVLTQGLVLPLLVTFPLVGSQWGRPAASVLLAINVGLLGMRFGLLLPLRASYSERGAPFWLSPLADPLAAARLVLSSLRRPRRWRGRTYRL